MSKRPDYDAGDLVEVIHAPNGSARLGSVFRCAAVFAPGEPNGIDGRRYSTWCARLVGFAPPAPHTAWQAHCFRKVRPASDSFTARIRACQPINGKVSA